jgi:hypothetical protein
LCLRLWAVDGRLRFYGPEDVVDDLVPELMALHDGVVDLIRDYRPGEAVRTPDAPWACECCRKWFSEDDLDADSWCYVCLGAVAEVSEALRSNPEADEETVGERHGCALARFLGLR